MKTATAKHELTRFDRCSFGDGGFYHGDNAHRAVCSCGWKSAASRDQKALIALWDVHQRCAPKTKEKTNAR